MIISTMAGNAQLDTSTTPARLRISGDWTLAHYNALKRCSTALLGHYDASTTIDLDQLGALDTAGASLLVELLGAQRLGQLAEHSEHLSAADRALLQTVYCSLTDFCEPVETLARGLFRPSRWRLTPMVAHIEQTGLDAAPIIALLTFLVGAVVAFLGATVLASFGASIFTVDLVAFSFLREFGVLLTAILMAGRTASAFTAQIGSMKANEEIDAIRTIGLDPMELLVLPRVLALLIALPMLTFLAMICGIVGGGVVCALSLGISPAMFLSLLQADIGIQHFLVGLVKAPFFAFLIAAVGCLEGFKVSGSAESVGAHTTSSVVQSIFIVIVLDAIAALFFMEMGW